MKPLKPSESGAWARTDVEMAVIARTTKNIERMVVWLGLVCQRWVEPKYRELAVTIQIGL